MNTSTSPKTTHQPEFMNSGSIEELVFDDDSVDALLYENTSSTPTPADALAIWKSGIDRSKECAKAVLSVISQNGYSQLPDIALDDFEDDLREFIKSECTASEEERADGYRALAFILQKKEQWIDAEIYCRKALKICEQTNGTDSKETYRLIHQLTQILKNGGKEDEAKSIMNQHQAWQIIYNDTGNLSKARALALDLVCDGQYDDAEAIYRKLLDKNFCPASTYCHLARVYLMTGRDAELCEVLEQAWQLRFEAPVYVLARIQFLRLLLFMLEGRNWKYILFDMEKILTHSLVHLYWTMEPVLDHLKSRLGADLHGMLAVLVDALGTRSKADDLRQNPIWEEACKNLEKYPDVPRITFGSVKKISRNCITLQEYSLDQKNPKPRNFYTDDKTICPTQFDLDEINKSRSILLEYTETNRKRTITTLPI